MINGKYLITIGLLALSVANYSHAQCDSTCVTPRLSDFATIPAAADTGHMPDKIIPKPLDCSLPWGGTIADGSSITAWNVAAGGFGGCKSEARSCSNGTLSGSYSFQSCKEVFNGQCGTAAGKTLATAPTATGTNLCTTGDSYASAVTTNPTTYTWSCSGAGGGNATSCSAMVPAPPPPPPAKNTWNDYAGYCAQLSSAPGMADPGSYICIVNNGYYFYNSNKTPTIQGMGWNYWKEATDTNFHWGIKCQQDPSSLALGKMLWPKNPATTCNLGEAGQEAYSFIIDNGRIVYFMDWYSGVTSYNPITQSEFDKYSVPLFPKNW